MILETTNGHIDLSVTQKKTNLTPLFAIDGTVLKFTDKFQHYYDAYSKVALAGVLASRDFDKNEDIIAFDEKDGSLVFLKFFIPCGIIVSGFSVELVSSNNELSFLETVWDSLESTHYSCYNEEKDELYFGYKPIEQWSDCYSEQAANDFFLILQNNRVIGWCLRHCSLHLCDNNDKKIDLQNDFRWLLASYFRFYKEENFDKTTVVDINLKEKLKELQDKSLKLGAFSISEALDEWMYWL